MTRREPYTGARWEDPPAVIAGGYVGVSKTDRLRVAASMLEEGVVTEEGYREELAEIEKKYKGLDPDEKI